MDGRSEAAREKDVYEYIPDTDPSKVSLPDANARISFFQKSGKQEGPEKAIKTDLVSDSIEPHASYEMFRKDLSVAVTAGSDATAPFLKGAQSEYEVMPSFVLSSVRNAGGGSKVLGTDDNRTARSTEGNALSRIAEARAEHSFAPSSTNYSQFETPIGRINRIESELNELYGYIDSKIKEKETQNAMDNSDLLQKKTGLRAEIEASSYLDFEPSALLKSVESLQSQISSLKGDTRVQSLFELLDPVTSKESGYNILMQHLELAKTPKMAFESGTMSDIADAPKESSMEYQLYYVPTMKPLLESARLTGFESRLTEIENKIGISKIGLLPFMDISTAISELSKRLSTLDTQRIEAISKRVQALLMDIQSIQAHRQVLEETPIRDDRLEFLYETCHRWKYLATAIPVVVKRLQTLKLLHQEASSAASRLKVVETQQNELKTIVEHTAAGFSKLKESMSETIEWAKRTAEGLEGRMEELRERH